MRDSPLLAAYRVASAGLELTGPPYLFWRGQLGLDDYSRRRERLGRPGIARPDGRLALVYAAGAAEALVLSPLAEKLGTLGFAVLLATGNADASPFRTARLPPLLHQLAPLDMPKFAARFLDHWRPGAVLIAGQGIPPNLVIETSLRKIPIALADARMSARSVFIWRRFPGFAASLMRRIDLCLAQTNVDAARFAAAGMRNVQVTGNLRYDFCAAPANQTVLARLMARIGTRPVWVADGTYAGEEKIALSAHCSLARKFPELLTVIAPLNAKRAFDIAQTAASLGLTAGMGGADRGTAPLPEIYIADRAGEAGLFYRCAGVVFSGKSISRDSGNNPLEAAGLGCAILHGPGVEEFEEIYAALDTSGGGALAGDAEALAKQLSVLFFDTAKLRAMGRAAARTAEEFGGASHRIVQALAPCLAPAMMRGPG